MIVAILGENPVIIRQNTPLKNSVWRIIMAYAEHKNPITVFLIVFLTGIAAYYICICLHEWGHGTAAWLYGVKSSPFAVNYGGWALLHVDENVDYDTLMANRHGVAAAIIGICGPAVSVIMFILSLLCLKQKGVQRHIVFYSFCFWVLIIDMTPILQYFMLTPFSSEGDTGRFVIGLNISPLWIFIPGALFVIFGLTRIFHTEVPRAYAVIPIKSNLGRRALLLMSLIFIFIWIYLMSFNPLTDPGSSEKSKIAALLSFLMVPILLILCDPSRVWVKEKIQRFKAH